VRDELPGEIPAMETAMLEIVAIGKTFTDAASGNAFVALDDVTLDVRERQFLCLLGPSGCGKTTLIRIVCGILARDRGELRIAGRPVRGPQTDCAMVFQNYGLLPWRTVRQNVELGLEIQGVSAAERRAVCQEFIERVGLTGFESHYPHQISGGMQQRTALARALSKKPKILLMDEPFAAVDMQTREHLQDELLKIWDKFRTTVIFVTHSIEEAVFLADRVVTMAARPGRVILDMPIELPRPRDATVKSRHEFGMYCAAIRKALNSVKRVLPPQTAAAPVAPAP
jgi:ABC-type nitrate/sulfonate/bicarbonate transport system ATPase subunit